jgi:O-methyltransferase
MLFSFLKSLWSRSDDFHPGLTALQPLDHESLDTPVPGGDATSNDSAKLYLDLLKKCVGNSIYDNDLDLMSGQFEIDPKTGRYVSTVASPVAAEAKYYGAMWPTQAHTMIGIPRLENIQWCAEQVLRHRVPGDFIETGVWRGGASIFMRGILKAYGITDRRVWVADSFEGLPKADSALNAADGEHHLHMMQDLAVSLEVVRGNFEKYGLLDEQVRFLKGWFCDSLPSAPIDTLAIMRLDGDLYESTMDALDSLYGKLSPGGYVIVDDYNALKACNAAIEDFRKKHDIRSELCMIDRYGAFWRK